MKPTRRDYCQFLLSSQVNCTQTYFADHHPHFSHDAINRYLQDDNVTPEELWIKVHGFPGDFKLKLFRVVVENSRTEWIVTNDFSQDSTDGTREMCAIRWKIEQYHREVKQTLGIEKCQCRSARSQRNHIGCSMLVWVYLTNLAREVKKNIYSIKREMLSSYMKQELRNPSVRMGYV